MDNSKEQGKRAISILVEALNSTDAKTSRQVWAIVTALRGPDGIGFEADRLKEYTTAKIRGAIGMKYEGVGAIISNKTPGTFSSEQYESVVKEVKEFNPSHFISHYDSAVSALEYFGFTSPPFLCASEVRNGNPYSVLHSLLCADPVLPLGQASVTQS